MDSVVVVVVVVLVGVAVAGGGYKPFTFIALVKNGLKYCTKAANRRAVFCSQKKKIECISTPYNMQEKTIERCSVEVFSQF